MIFQDVRRNAIQAYIKYKTYYDKKANASKLKQSDYVYILQPKADHQGSKIPSTDFRLIGPYIIEKVLPNNNYVVRKIGTNKTQLLHRMRLRQFTPRQPIPDTPVTPREWQPDPDLIIKHDDFINFSYTANSVILILPLKPRELQSVSRLTARAASLSLRLSFFQVTLSISAAFKDFKFLSLFTTMYRNPSPNSTNSDVF